MPNPTLNSATIEHDAEGLPLLSSGPSSPTRSARPQGTEQRVFYMIAEGSIGIDHYDDPRSFHDGLRLASMFHAKTLDENTEVCGALGYEGKLGRCSSGFRSLCRARQKLRGQSCMRHEIMEYAERVGRVTEYWVLDHDPISKTNSSNTQAIPVWPSESWESKQISLSSNCAQQASQACLRGL